VAKISYKAPSASKIVKHLICAAALAAGSVAQAGVLNFNNSDPNLMFDNSYNEDGAYWYQTYSGNPGGLAGAIVDGSDLGSCSSPIVCPGNNNSKYFASVDDGFMVFGLKSGAPFKLGSMAASLVGAGQTFANISAVLLVQGLDNDFNFVGGAYQIPLYGPTNGAFSFANYNLSSITQTFTNVLLYAYTCDTTGSCSRGGGIANFAVDDIVTVPEPVSIGLFGLGLAGLGAIRRRRAV